MNSILLCTALAAWSLGGGQLSSPGARMQVRLAQGPAGHVSPIYPGYAGAWQGGLLLSSPRPLSSTPKAPAPRPGLCTGPRFGADGRPLSTAWGSRAYVSPSRCAPKTQGEP